jgi:receptor-type tyrosine-protein phosphatase F
METLPKKIDVEKLLKKRNVEKLRDHLRKVREVNPNDSSINGFDEEFWYIEEKSSQQQSTTESALLPVNRSKNRYSNVLPPEYTRVKLKEIDGIEGSDYINANYIDGLIPGSEKAYIATQGPLQSTFVDFWRMVWETNSCVIVMLTKEIENGRIKCDKYWPDIDIPLNIESKFKIELLNIIEKGDEEIERKLKLTNLETDEEREVTQFQYIAWPDHGLPESVNAFVELAEKVDEANKNKGPIVVHCSAGIGRSGTFCTVHSTLEKIKQDMANKVEPQFNIIETILKLRLMRPGMVQTKEQYMFCCFAIVEEGEKLLGKNNNIPKITMSEINNNSVFNSIKNGCDDGCLSINSSLDNHEDPN